MQIVFYSSCAYFQENKCIRHNKAAYPARSKVSNLADAVNTIKIFLHYFFFLSPRCHQLFQFIKWNDGLIFVTIAFITIFGWVHSVFLIWEFQGTVRVSRGEVLLTI